MEKYSNNDQYYDFGRVLSVFIGNKRGYVSTLLLTNKTLFFFTLSLTGGSGSPINSGNFLGKGNLQIC